MTFRHIVIDKGRGIRYKDTWSVGVFHLGFWPRGMQNEQEEPGGIVPGRHLRRLAVVERIVSHTILGGRGIIRLPSDPERPENIFA
jgi:hypothetical protein